MHLAVQWGRLNNWKGGGIGISMVFIFFKLYMLAKSEDAHSIKLFFNTNVSYIVRSTLLAIRRGRL
jgi:hypothetical protein